ncbi:hypothetical protein J4221_01725 [Candidatus Pacearchaeota archaeon]|nr:hypothetical protein [Candidatus Pacearchaeota archaeon]
MMRKEELDSLSDRAVINLPLKDLQEIVESEENLSEVMGTVLSGFLEVADDPYVSLKKLKGYITKVNVLMETLDTRTDIPLHERNRHRKMYCQLIRDYVPYALRNGIHRRNSFDHPRSSHNHRDNYYKARKVTLFHCDKYQPNVEGEWQ